MFGGDARDGYIVATQSSYNSAESNVESQLSNQGYLPARIYETQQMSNFMKLVGVQLTTMALGPAIEAAGAAIFTAPEDGVISAESLTPEIPEIPLTKPFTADEFADLSFDPEKGRVTQGSIEEIRAAQAAQTEGLLGSGSITRGQNGADLTVDGTDVSIKAYRDDSIADLENQRSLSKLFGSLYADPNVTLLLDTRALTESQVNNITNALVQKGVDPSRIIAPSPKSYGPIYVVSPDGNLTSY